jgi:transcriptional regulator with XRE-family HTH domain
MEVNGAALTEIIERSGYRTQAEFASRVAITPSYLSELMRGLKPGSPEVIKRMARELRCPVTAIIKDPDAAEAVA